MTLFDDSRQLAVEKGQEQGTDVRPIDVGVGHEDNRVIAELGQVCVFFSDSRSQSRDEQFDFLRGEHLVETGFFHVEDFSA